VSAGFPDHARLPHQPVLAAAGFHAVAPFMRGYAPSDVPLQGPYQSAALAEDAVALIEALGHDRAVVFGHDWGAVAAYGAAVLAPQRVIRLVTAAVPHGAAFPTALLTNYEQQRRSWYMFFFRRRSRTVRFRSRLPLPGRCGRTGRRVGRIRPKR
jgi:pimeloyl-ACP methyl ester carboxylesterase